MSFQLYKNDPCDPPRRPITFRDLDNKAFWCQHGEQQEIAFVNVMRQIEGAYTIKIHPSKQHNRYHPDLLCLHKVTLEERVGEVKIKNSPLFFGRKKYNIPSQYALTMDLKDSFNYANYLANGIDILIFIWVKWEAHEMVTPYSTYRVNPMKGVWRVPFSRLRERELMQPPPIHWYKERFRHAPSFPADSRWGQMLLKFDTRLADGTGRVKNITSKGLIERNGRLFPSGHSSCSYVFNLNDDTLFDTLIFREYV